MTLIRDETGEALLRCVLLHPEDDTPRLIYADWLEDNGQGLYAEFIRVQCELARLEEIGFAHCRRLVEKGKASSGDPDGHEEERIQLRQREKQLWGYHPAKHGIMHDIKATLPEWAILLPSDAGRGLTDHYPWATVRRGFVSEVRCTCQTWLDCAGEIMASHPVRHVNLTDKEPTVESVKRVGWWTNRIFKDDSPNHHLPQKLFRLLGGGEKGCYNLQDIDYRTYISKQAALDDLSNACLLYARNAPERLLIQPDVVLLTPAQYRERTQHG